MSNANGCLKNSAIQLYGLLSGNIKAIFKEKDLATYAFARMKKLMEEEFPSFEDDDYAHMASVQITVLADMLQSGILSYNDLYQETLEVIEQLLG